MNFLVVVAHPDDRWIDIAWQDGSSGCLLDWQQPRFGSRSREGIERQLPTIGYRSASMLRVESDRPARRSTSMVAEGKHLRDREAIHRSIPHRSVDHIRSRRNIRTCQSQISRRGNRISRRARRANSADLSTVDCLGVVRVFVDSRSRSHTGQILSTSTPQFVLDDSPFPGRSTEQPPCSGIDISTRRSVDTCSSMISLSFPKIGRPYSSVCVLYIRE